MLESFFKLKEHNTNVRTEVMAGVTTFMTMAYIIFVNPSILSATGMPFGAVMVATALSAAFATLLMSVLANYPFALAPGMGLNAFFTYTVVLGMGLSWQAALAAVFVSGVLFLLLTLTKAREAIVNAIPMSLKLAVGAGIGLFIAFIGFKNAGIIVSDPATFLKIVNPHLFQDPNYAEYFKANFITPQSVLLSIIGLLVTGFLVVRRTKGALLYGILLTTIIGIPMGVTNISNFQIVSMPPSIGEIFFKMNFNELASVGWLTVIFTFAFVDLFDTIGTLVGVASKADMLDEKGHLPRANKALLADSVGTIFGSVMGTSTVTTYVESASGVAEGGRTGLTSLTTAILFFLSIFFSPLVAIIPGAATAPILIIVGIFMMESVMKINFSDMLEAIPAFLTIVIMPFSFSIAEGIVAGVLAYTFLHALTGRIKDVSLTMWILTGIFVLRFFIV
ncbi:NCS2 family permease [Metallumcola ferriviriculae]|uniref:NCS2 family permease n=2 Tax=Metallumcola ferriviriculae TaxID=3039180 RepID=A0AAU0UQ90_9FIRM|nr:NCS2 family permease [Desulfitibacteraceae bacterium MK1]